jgi:hypothetical protein
LILKRLLGEITKEEDSELQALAKGSEEDREFIARMSPEAFHKRLSALKPVNYKRLFRLMKRKMGQIPGVLEWVPETTWIQRTARPLSIAASILLIAALGWWFKYKSRSSETILRQPTQARLLWDSDTIDLGKMPEGKAVNTGRMWIARMGNEFFVNQWLDTVAAVADTTEYQIAVAGGGDIQVFFQDLTKAQITSGSVISFRLDPPGAILKQKEIACIGQVFFDVSHHFETPFIVKTPKQEVIVLGTQFRVRDFTKEDTSAVFCYSGKVIVKDPELETQTLVGSQQRVTVRPKHAPMVSTGDFPQAQWSSPELYFDFTHLDLDSAMKEIARWYGISNVEIDRKINRKIRGTVMFGKISRYLPLQQLLSTIESTDLHFSIQGQTILVTTNGDH